VLKELRRELPEGCISDLRFDQWRAGEIQPEVIEQLEEHLGNCERCQLRHDAIEAQAEAFLAAQPKLELPEPSPGEAKAFSVQSKRARLLAYSGGVAGLAAAAAFVLLLGTTGPDGPVAERGIRSKGSSRVGFSIKHGDLVRAGGDGQVVYPGDQLRFSVSSLKSQHLAVFSLDGAGVASVYYPDGDRSKAVGVLRDHSVESSVLLDGTPGEEHIWGVFCDEPFDVEPLREAIERSGALPQLADCTVDEYSLVKKATP
jgi:hypothetical protein